MSVIKAFLVSPLKWLRVTVAVIFFIGIAYAFLHHIPAWSVPNMTGGGEGMEDSFSLARWQFVPSVLGTLRGAAVSAEIHGVLLLLTLLFGRVYCSFVCPLGILQDIVFRIRRWLAPKRFLKFSRPVPWVRYGVLALLAACCVTNLTLAYTIRTRSARSVRLGLLINNLFNAEYESNGYGYSYMDTRSGPAPVRIDEAYYFPQAPLIVLANVTAKF